MSRQHPWHRAFAAGAAILAAALCSLPVAANPALLFDVTTGQVLAHQDAFQRWYPASLTKLMTAYVTFRAIDVGELSLRSPITISKHAAGQPPSKMGYKPGEVISLDNALKMLVVKSANDIAMAIGENVGGNERAFVARMNREAFRLGMAGTRFVNPNGLHDLGQFTNAHDLAVLVRALRTEFPQYASYFTIEAIGAGKKTMKTNVDLLGRFTGADGMKTGFICPSGFNLIASATRNKQTLAVVILGSINPHVRADQAADMLGKGFEQKDVPTTTLETLKPYGDGQQTATDMRAEICLRPARTEKLDKVDDKGKPIFTSPYLHDRPQQLDVVAVGPGGADGPVPQAFAEALAAGVGPDISSVPVPTPRPDYPTAADQAPGAGKADQAPDAGKLKAAKADQVGG